MADLTKTQQGVLHLLMVEHMRPQDIAIRRGTSIQNIHQIIKKLRKKGALDKQNLTGLNRRGVVSKKTSAFWRFHKLHFVMRPYYFEPRYEMYRKKFGNYGINYGDWVFTFHADIVEMRLKEGVDFVDAHKYQARAKSELSFNKYLTLAGNKYGFHVIKDQKANIRIVDQHLACTGSGVAKGRHTTDYVQIRGVHDNKVYFVFDKSKGPVEHEYVHSDLAISDSETFEPYFNSIRHEQHYLPHETKQILDTILSVQLQYAENMKEHVAVMKEIREGLKELRVAVKEWKR